MVKHADNWGGLSPEDSKLEQEMYDAHVPASGKADTVGGEILRAICRIVYKFYNDGDTVARYYSSTRNLSWACDRFLYDNVPGYCSMKDVDFDHFEDAACKNLKTVVDYLKETPSVFETKNYTDCIANAPEMDYYEDDWDDDWDDEDDDE